MPSARAIRCTTGGPGDASPAHDCRDSGPERSVLGGPLDSDPRGPGDGWAAQPRRDREPRGRGHSRRQLAPRAPSSKREAVRVHGRSATARAHRLHRRRGSIEAPRPAGAAARPSGGFRGVDAAVSIEASPGRHAEDSDFNLLLFLLTHDGLVDDQPLSDGADTQSRRPRRPARHPPR